MAEEAVVRREAKRGAMLTLGDAFVTFDAITSEDTAYSATVTQHPIEDGSRVADHVVLDPVKLSLRGVFTDIPLPSTGEESRLGRSVELLDALLRLMTLKEPLVVTTTLRTFESMVITAVNVPRDQQTGRSCLVVEVELEQVVRATFTIVDIPADSVAEEDRPRASSTDAGEQPAADAGAVEDVAEPLNESILDGIIFGADDTTTTNLPLDEIISLGLDPADTPITTILGARQ